MKKTIIVLLSLGLVLSGCSKKIKVNHLLDMTPSVIESKDFEKHHYSMDLKLDTKKHTVGGNMQVSIYNASDDDWQEVYFRDYTGCVSGKYMTIDNVSDGNNKLDVQIGEDKSVIGVTLNQPLKTHERMTISMDFTAYFDELTFGRFTMYQTDDLQQYNMGNFYPVLSYYEDGKWLNQPYVHIGECFYTPCSDYEVNVEVPEDFMLVATGKETYTTNDNGTLTYHYAENTVRDIAMSACNQYEKQTQIVDGIEVNSVYIKGNEELGKQALEYGSQAVALFNRYANLHPYDSIDIVATYNLHAGGMEYPGHVMIGEHYYQNRGDEGQSLSKVVVHELAHLWTYGIVGNNEYDEAWLDESNASFLTMVYNDYFNEELYEAEIERNKEFPPRSDDTIITKAYNEYDEDEMTSNYITAVYTHGSIFLNEIRLLVGDQTFMTMMQDYVNTYAFKEAKTEDFLAMIEKYVDKDLSELYEKYIEPQYYK